MAEKISVGKFINNMDKEDLTSTDLQGVVGNVYAKAIADHKKTTKIADDNLKDKDKETVEFTKSNHDRLKANKDKVAKEVNKDDAKEVKPEGKTAKGVEETKGSAVVESKQVKEDFERKLEPGDKIIVRGTSVTIGDILDQYFDKKFIDIEFKDDKGRYRTWKSDIDGGKVVYKESKQVNEVAENEFEVVKYKGNQYGIWAKTSKNWMMFGKKADLEKRVKELNAGHKDYKKIDEALLEPGNIYSVLVKELPAEDIDHHYSDLYVRKTPKSTEIVNRLTTKSLLSTFKDNIDGDTWYELPFCYTPHFGESKKLTETPIPRNATKIKVGGKEFTKEKDWVDGNRVHVSPKDIKRLYGNDVEVLETDPNYKSKRTKEVKVLQGNYGYGWDDLVEYDKEDSAELKQDLKSYRENERNAQFRVVTRRVPLGEDKLTETVKSNLFQPSVDPWERHLIDTSAWIKGTIVKDGAEYQVSAKVFNEPSQYGINHGRISKLWVKEKGWPVAINYDRGWVDAPPHNDDLLNTVMKELEAYRDKHPISVKESMNKSRKVTESKTPYGGTTIEDYVNVNFNGSQENKDKLIAKVKKKAIGGDYFNGLNMSVKDWKKAGEEFGLTMKSYPVTESKETCASWKVTYGKGRPGGSEEIIKAKDYEEAKQLAAKHANGWGFEVKRVNESKKLTEAPTIDSYEKGDFKAYYGTSKDEDEDPNKPYYSNMNLFDKNGEVIGSFGYSRFEDEESAKKDFEKKKKAIDRSLGKTQATGKKLREDWTVFEFTSGSNPYIAKTDKEVKRLLRKYKGKVRKINDTHYEVDDKKNFDWDKPMVDNDSLPFGPGAPLEEAKGKKVYVVIEISRDSDVPKLIGVYSNKSDAEKDAYSEGRRWCNVIETTLKGSLKDESLKEARYNDGVAKGQHIASVDLFSTGVSDEDKKKAKELGHYEIDLDNKVFTRVKGNHWLGHWRIESYPRDTWEEVEKTARNIMKDGNFKEVSNDKYIEIQKDWENKRH